MADYVLVHGGQRDGSVWDDVAVILRAAGHGTFAPTLSRPAGSTLGEHIAEVSAVIEDNGLDTVILVGHSYGTFVITGVADRVPGRIKRLVYVDGAVPEDGKSLYGMFEDVGVTSEEYGLPQDPPFLEPLHFDTEKLRCVPKAYIHCTRSEFLQVAGPAYEALKPNAERDNWELFEIDSDHPVMVSHPGELAAILLGEQG